MLKEKLNLGLSKRLEQQTTMLQTGYFRALAQEIITTLLNPKLQQLEEVIQEAQRKTKELNNTKSVKGDRGDKGDKPVAGIDFQVPKGSPDTPEDIAKKLNTLTEVINWQVIRGLKKEFAKVSGNKQTGGGGIGNVQHETKAVGSSTTTVTTTYSIAGGGYAIWAYYNGQLIMRGTHYTVSGKTLTLTFTPQDNTNIDIIYIR